MSTKTYAESRAETDRAHEKYSRQLYEAMGFEQYEDRTPGQIQLDDQKLAIDYLCHETKTKFHQKVYMQDRFRDVRSARNYQDFTLRLERPDAAVEQLKSELYKLQQGGIPLAKAEQAGFVLAYSVIDYQNEEVVRSVAIDLKKLINHIEAGDIVLDEIPSGKRYNHQNEVDADGAYHPLIRMNVDREGADATNSSYVCFDVRYLYALDKSIIAFNNGFDTRLDVDTWIKLRNKDHSKYNEILMKQHPMSDRFKKDLYAQVDRYLDKFNISEKDKRTHIPELSVPESCIPESYNSEPRRPEHRVPER